MIVPLERFVVEKELKCAFIFDNFILVDGPEDFVVMGAHKAAVLANNGLRD